MIETDQQFSIDGNFLIDQQIWNQPSPDEQHYPADSTKTKHTAVRNLPFLRQTGFNFSKQKQNQIFCEMTQSFCLGRWSLQRASVPVEHHECDVAFLLQRLAGQAEASSG